jgi:hypothetical protein
MLLIFRLLVGGRPTTTHFSLLSPKKSKQKKGDRTSLPLRGARLCSAKNGKTSKLTSLRFVQTRRFLIHFLHYTNGSAYSGKAQNLKANENVQLITPHKNRAINRKDHEWKAGSS